MLPEPAPSIASALAMSLRMGAARTQESVPEPFRFLFTPARYKVAYGGRGSGKSWSFARALVLRARERPQRILCTRELQTSIKESVHHLLEEQIELLKFTSFFTVQQQGISARNGSEFIFAGLRNNVTGIKSLEGIDVAWVEEAASISEQSWATLTPTVRKAGSEIWVSFNPDQESDPTYHRFVIAPPPDAIVRKVTWRDNPHFPAELEGERAHLASVDADAHAHIWEGECATVSDAQILKGKVVVQEFEPYFGFDGPYQGADWGFSSDPTTMVRCWIHDRTLYIEYEAYGHGVDIDRTPALFDEVPRAREYVLRADNARPETISYMQRHGYPRVEAVEKWPDSIVDGLTHLRSYEKIVIHPRCEHAIEEARLYRYKVDRLTGDVLPQIVDKHNHIWDAVRYALAPVIRLSQCGTWAFGSM
jgi:phage terminase large subunit